MDFEKSPFKLSEEMIFLIGGVGSDTFIYFKTIFQLGFMALRKNYRSILTAIELMQHSTATGGLKMACFQGVDTIANLKGRFKLDLDETGCLKYCEELIFESIGNWRTLTYDRFQYFSNGILG